MPQIRQHTTSIWYLYILLRITVVVKIGLMRKVESYLQKPFNQ